MAFIKLPLGIKIVLEYELNGEPVINVYHATTPDPITSVKLTTIAQICVNWWISTQAAAFSNDLTLLAVSCTDLTKENGERITYPAIPFTTGGLVEEAAPNNVAQVISLVTAKTGRSFQGRSYLCGLTQSAITDNEITLSASGALAANFADLMSDLDAVSVVLSVASFYHNQLPRVEGVATPVESLRVRTRVDTQRRRLPKE